jgi:hypothetical protein
MVILATDRQVKMEMTRGSKITWWFIFLGLFVFVLCSYGCKAKPAAEKKKGADQVKVVSVATVNGEPVSVLEIQEYLALRPPAGKLSSREAVRERLRELVTMQVLAQEARRRRLDREPAVKYSVEQLLARTLIDQAVAAPVAAREISGDEIEAWYQDHIRDYVRPRQIRLADIFIQVPENGSSAVWEEKRREAVNLLSEAQQKKEERFGFSTLVREYSDKHPLYALGDTGYFDEQGEPLGIDPALARAAFTLKDRGAIYPEVVQTSQGFHIIMLVAVRAATEKKIADVSAEIRQRIRKQELEQKRAAFIQDLVDEAQVTIREEQLQILASSLEKSGGKDGFQNRGKRSGGASSAPPVSGTPQE